MKKLTEAQILLRMRNGEEFELEDNVDVELDPETVKEGYVAKIFGKSSDSSFDGKVKGLQDVLKEMGKRLAGFKSSPDRLTPQLTLIDHVLKALEKTEDEMFKLERLSK